MRALYRTETVYHGEYATMTVYPVFETKRKRGGRYRPTSDVQQMLNDENARERVAWQLNANYKTGDGFWLLTYEPGKMPKTRQDAVRTWQNFKKRLVRRLGERRLVAVIHGDAGENAKRLHIHVCVDADVSPETMAELWGLGIVSCRTIRKTRWGLRGLAHYMLDGMEWGRVLTTRNLIQPAPKTRTGGVSRELIETVKTKWDETKAYEGLLPGYAICDVHPYFNWFNRFYYLRVEMYRTDAGFIDERLLTMNDVQWGAIG